MSLWLVVKVLQEKTDDHALVYWPEEDCISVVKNSGMLDSSPPVAGASCQVRVGKKTYAGAILKIGMFVTLVHTLQYT